MMQILRNSGWVTLLLVLRGPAAAAEDYAAGADNLSSLSSNDVDLTQIVVAPPTNAEPEYRQYFESYRESLANHSYDEAATAAKQILGLASAGAHADRLRRSAALHNLAVAQHGGENYDAAILNYQTAIDMIAEDQDLLSEDLLMPLRGLGAAYLKRLQPEEALQTYDRALHVSNVNHGPHSMQQQPILHQIMQMYLEQGETDLAVEILDRIEALYYRQYSRDSEELLPVLYLRTELMDELGHTYPERVAWRQIATIISKNRGESHVDLIEPYMALGRNLTSELNRIIYRSGPHAATAEWYFRHALSIAEKSPDTDWATRKKCLLALADYYTLVEMHAQARERYREVWDLMTADAAYLAQRKAELETVVPVSQTHPHPYANFVYNPDTQDTDPADYLDGTMLVRFTVNGRGRVKNVEIMESIPPKFERMEWRVRKSLKKFVYRPRFVDREPVDTDNYLYRHDYFYLQSVYEAAGGNSRKLSRSALPGVE